VNDTLVFALRFGILALCAVVGIYYALLRRPATRQDSGE
jgi:hypothetical protein